MEMHVIQRANMRATMQVPTWSGAPASRGERREFLRAGTLGLHELHTPLPLAGREAEARKLPSGIAAANDGPRSKACIILFMWGGPAHQDTWDLKPAAPSEYRGEFSPIQSNVSGIPICEHLPRLAHQIDKLAIIRSMTHGDVDRTHATHHRLTGRGDARRDRPLDLIRELFGVKDTA